jgi:multicomponent Na+:H+ antiporter subunit D
MAAFTIGALSMIGLPPTAGFISKWYMLSAAWQTDYHLVVGVIILSTLLNAAYFLPIIYRAFFRAPPKQDVHHPLSSADGEFGDETHPEAQDHGHGHHDDHGEAPWPAVLALSCTALATVAFFFYSDLAIDLAAQLQKGLLK